MVTGEASFHAPFEHCTIKYLEQAGLHPTWLDLAKEGVHGNGHMMMLEKNNLQIADLIVKWLDKTLSVKSPSGHTARLGAAN